MMTNRERVLVLVKELEAQTLELKKLAVLKEHTIKELFKNDVLLPLKSVTARAENMHKIITLITEVKSHE